MNSFRRGLRNRNPLVLVVALALLVPALLGIQSWFTSGAWTAIAAQRWERNSTDDYMFVSWTVGHLKKHPPDKPLAVLLGGSSGREALVSGPSLAREVEADGGPDIVAYNLSSRMQRYAQSWAIVDNLPDTPTTVLVGVNLGRFTTSPESNYNQVIGRELLLKSDSLRRWVTARSGEHKYSYTILPGIFSALASYLQQKENALLKGSAAQAVQGARLRLPAGPARRGEAGPGAEVAQAVLPGVQEGPQVRRGHARRPARRGQAARPRHGRSWSCRGTGRSSATPSTRRSPPTRRRRRPSPQKYDVPYLDFNEELAIPSEDFLDLSHLRPEGRAIWQAELARQLAALYDDGTLRTEL